MPIKKNLLPTDIILTPARQRIARLSLDRRLQPGNYLDFEGKTYAILERHHFYQYRVGGYRFDRATLHVQESQRPEETTLIGDRYIIGNADCRFNARSEIMRCAVNPEGPCQDCRYF
ncbi:MAG: DUF6464 family protein, partial [Cyanobacteria bacterium J06553_1]